MSAKSVFGMVFIGICLILALIIGSSIFHVNNISQIQVIQSFTGKTSIRTQGGIYMQIMPRIWTYNKTNQVAFSFVKDESKDNDGVHVFFANKGQGDISTQITYNLISEEEKVYKLHELAKGDDDVIDRRILATIREVTMREAGLITSSEAIEKREEFANKIRKELLHNPDYTAIGIDITQFTITNIEFDDLTIEAYKKAQEADLKKKTAEAEKLNLEMQKERVEAEAAMEIAQSKGKAEVEKTKAETDAEKEKKLAEIAAEQRVAVAELEKKEATAKAEKEAEVARIEAQKEAEVAKITLEMEKTKLDTVKVQAEQKIAEAEAKQKAIELAGEMKEAEKITLEKTLEAKVKIADAISKGLVTLKLPTTVFWGGGEGGAVKATSAIDYLINILTVQKANELAAVAPVRGGGTAPAPAK